MIIDKFTFNNYIVNICKKVNNKLFSIKRLAYLPFSVRLQFFKTFILPLFDYCLSLFLKNSNKKLTNCYNACLFKLFKFDFTFKNLDEINNFLENFKLFGFQHRIVLRLSLFSHKIMNIPSAPELKSQILYSSDRNIIYNLRNTTKTTLYLPKTNNHYGELTFKYFFNLFVEKICKHIIIMLKMIK